MPGASLEGIDPLARTCAHFGFGKSALLPLFSSLVVQVWSRLAVRSPIRATRSRRSSQDTAATFHSARNQAFTAWADFTGVAMGCVITSVDGRHPTPAPFVIRHPTT
jgi:hypothetical protein